MTEHKCNTCKHETDKIERCFARGCGSCNLAWEPKNGSANTAIQETGSADTAVHYQKAAMQPVQVIQRLLTPEQFDGWLLGNVIKYKLRAQYKGHEAVDLRKAKQYEYWRSLVTAGVLIDPAIHILKNEIKDCETCKRHDNPKAEECKSCSHTHNGPVDRWEAQ